jgi:hypothetical protein
LTLDLFVSGVVDFNIDLHYSILVLSFSEVRVLLRCEFRFDDLVLSYGFKVFYWVAISSSGCVERGVERSERGRSPPLRYLPQTLLLSFGSKIFY